VFAVLDICALDYLGMKMINHRCEIVAEIGINFQGDLALAHRMIKAVKRAGADAAKFQLYDPKTLLKPSYFSADDWSMILQSELTFDVVMSLWEMCGAERIEFLASAFDLERLDWLERLNVKRHKIASRSVYDKEYVHAVKATKKQMIVSGGWLMSEDGVGVDDRLIDVYNDKREVTVFALNRIMEGAGDRVRLLYCVSKYPTRLTELRGFPKRYDFYDGFSDHTSGMTAAKMAIARGARIVEKHVTYDKRAAGPDHAGSATFRELADLCRFRDEVFLINEEAGG
jgi:N-acetylneuraminate synthase/N,N'-diacetyllegionaminate synthase